MLLDGGIRRGTDVLKAVALGAIAVGIGRAHLWDLRCRRRGRCRARNGDLRRRDRSSAWRSADGIRLATSMATRRAYSRRLADRGRISVMRLAGFDK